MSERLTQVGHDMAQLRSTDEAVAIAVKDLEGLDQLLFGVSVLRNFKLLQEERLLLSQAGVHTTAK